ncbi:MAG: valine--tRNA ligase [Candidatus Caenarcaniphilales bacterium]|nr:valine--tRNA ligase [Candidatus Caenarcaniphilales bacterium]
MSESTESSERLAKSYEPSTIEPKWREIWEKNKINEVTDPLSADFAIALPPPNVTGELHMGHALNDTLQDILIRYHRMKGKKVHWQIGCDHAGIGTQIVVEKQLAKEGKTKYDLGRDEFEKKVWEWTKKHLGRIEDQMRLLGFSPDWSKSKFTLDEDYVEAVRKSFFEYFKQGLIYKGTRLINWCPHCLTSISDLEVVHEDRNGKLYKIKYKLVEAIGDLTELIVATSRPETLFGDVAVAINPNDERYKELSDKIKTGKKVLVELPLTGKQIPVITSDAVLTDFGTGALKITPAHDFNDQEIAKTWNSKADKTFELEQINIFNEKAHLLPLEFIPADLHSKERFKARESTIQKLQEQELMLEEEKYSTAAALHDRCGTVIEPFLSPQWFVYMKPLAKLAIDALKENQVKFHPERYGKTYLDWLENIQDWCISRQLWWGHPVPVWSKKLTEEVLQNPALSEQEHERLANEFKFIVKEAGYTTKLTSDRRHSTLVVGSKGKNEYVFQYSADSVQVVTLAEDPALEELLQKAGYTKETDVLDTWFSSALWPFAAQGWPVSPSPLAPLPKSGEGNKPKPWTSVLITAREIINLWVSRMIYSSINLTDRLPFTNILIHPVIQTPDGKRMSKSKGNAIDPIELVNKYGADASRLWYCSVGIFANQDTRFPGKREKDENGNQIWTSPVIEQKRRFINKLWNATKFVIQNTSPPNPLDRGSLRGLQTFWDINKSTLEILSTLTSEENISQNTANIWIISRWNEVLRQAHEHLANYRFTEYGKVLEDFVWNDFCDWYLELAKLESPPNPLDRGNKVVPEEALFETGELKTNVQLLESARNMRKNPTAAEEKLWNEVLRNSQTGCKFTRQKAVGNFILDFYCSELLLGIEVDGEVHANQKEYDQERTKFLNSIGIEIIRFTNDEVLNQIDKVQKTFSKVIQSRKESISSPCQGGWGVTQQTLFYILEQVLRALHPITPFVSEELWQSLTGSKEGIAKQPYPEAAVLDEELKTKIESSNLKIYNGQKIVETIRSVRQKTLGLAPSHELQVKFESKTHSTDQVFIDTSLLHRTWYSIAKSKEFLGIDEPLLSSVHKNLRVIRKPIQLLKTIELIESSSIKILVPDNVNLKEREHILQKDLDKCIEEKTKLEARYKNPGFFNNAPEEVKNEMRSNLERLQQEISELEESIQQIKDAENML